MSYQRMINRGKLTGTYSNVPADADATYYQTATWLRQMVAGDLRRVENDQRDEWHLTRRAAKTGLTSEQVKKVLDSFFEDDLL